MKLQEFIEIFCSEELERSKNKRDLLLEDDFFSYDAIVELDDGTTEKVIYDSEETMILLFDVLTLTDVDFCKIYPKESSLDARNKYLTAYEFIEGMDVITQFRNQFKESEKRIEVFKDLGLDD